MKKTRKLRHTRRHTQRNGRGRRRRGTKSGGFFKTIRNYFKGRPVSVGDEKRISNEDYNSGDEMYLSNFVKCKKSNIFTRKLKWGSCRELSHNLYYRLPGQGKELLKDMIVDTINPKTVDWMELNKPLDQLVKKEIKDFYVRTTNDPYQYIGNKTLPNNIPKDTKDSVVFPAALYLDTNDIENITTRVDRRLPILFTDQQTNLKSFLEEDENNDTTAAEPKSLGLSTQEIVTAIRQTRKPRTRYEMRPAPPSKRIVQIFSPSIKNPIHRSTINRSSIPRPSVSEQTNDST
jgi:hypothetical protein